MATAQSSAKSACSAAPRFAYGLTVSVIPDLVPTVSDLMAQLCNPIFGEILVGLQDASFGAPTGPEETSLTTTSFGWVPINVLLTRFFFTSKSLEPFGVTMQPQHSSNCSLLNT